MLSLLLPFLFALLWASSYVAAKIGLIDATPEEKQGILETFDVQERLDKVLSLMSQRIQILRLSKEIGDQTQQSLSSQQRQHILREQLRQIQKQLGEGDEKSVEIAELRDKIEKAGMPKEAEEQAKKELKRLERMPESAAEDRPGSPRNPVAGQHKRPVFPARPRPGPRRRRPGRPRRARAVAPPPRQVTPRSRSP